MRRPLILIAALVVAALVAPASASAAIRFKRCAGDSGLGVFFAASHSARGPARLLCARVPVPLDRSGTVPGVVRLNVERVRAPRRGRAPVFVLAGGPGQAATPLTTPIAEELGPALRNRDLIVFDQRGTGGSGVLRCRELERANLLSAAQQAGRCGERLGPRRQFYRTVDSVEDIETLRQRLEVEQIALYGVSYGTKVALAYAARYPARVERLVLDSVLEVEGPDPFYREIFTAVPRVLGDVCRPPRCSGITADPSADLAALVARLAGGPLRGYVVGPSGRRRPATLGRVGLLTVLLAGDFDVTLRSALPGAIRSALNGDLAPVLRLARRARGIEGEPLPPSLLSAALYATTLCEETALPWQRAAASGERRRQAAERAAAIPASAFAPFDAATALATDIIRLCERWPAGGEPPPLPSGPLPDVRALLFAGEQDLRTPLEGARRVAQQLPRAKVMTVPATGHSVVSSDLSGCALRALRAFLRDRAVRTRCRRRDNRLPAPDPVAPTSLAEVRSSDRRRPGRTLRAVRLTIGDALEQALLAPDSGSGALAGGGLRGGRFRLRIRGLEALEREFERLAPDASDRELEAAFDRVVFELALYRIAYVPGVRVTGKLRITEAGIRGRLRVSGASAAKGIVAVRGDERSVRLSGRLGGRRVRMRNRLGHGMASSAVAARRPRRVVAPPVALPSAEAR